MSKDQIIANKIAMVADLTDEAIPGFPLVEIVGDRRVLIERHLGVTEYNKESISVKVKFGKICVCGSGLTLIQMTKTKLVIQGMVFSVQIVRE